MAKGNGERPAKKGTVDSTLLELQETLSRPKPLETGPAQVVTAPEVVQTEVVAEPVPPSEPVSIPEISPINPVAPEAEASEPKGIPPELKAIYGDTVPAGKIEMFEKLKGTKKREDYLAKLAVDEKEKKERQSKKPTKPRVRKPKPTPVEDIKAQMQKEAAEEVRRMTVARASALKPSGADPDAPTIKIEVPDRAVDVTAEPDGRIEPMIDSEPLPVTDEEVPDWNWPKSEGTHKELTEKLREAVGKVVGGTKEKFEWWKSSEEGLIRRSKELDAEAEKMGVIGKTFLKMGEQYNKLGWKSKLAVGIGLGIGAGVSAATVSMPGIIAFTLGITAQRSLGLATMYLKYEKNTQEGEWRKEKAFGKAFAYTASMTGAMMLLSEGVKEGVEYAKQHQWDDRVHEWLGAMLGHEPAPSSELPKEVIAPKNIPDATPVAPAVAEVAPASPPEAPAATAAAGEVAAPASVPAEDHVAAASEVAAPASEVPDISVEATKGRGYEYMMKRLWEQLQEKHLDANAFDANSDIHKLLTADAETIDTVVHQIAMDPKHGFFHADGTSVRIDMGSHLAVNAEGQLELNGAVQAPPGAPVYHPEAPAPTPEAVVPPPPAETVDLTTAQDEAAKHISPPPLQEAPASATPSTPSAGEQPLSWRTGSGGELVDSSGNPVHAGVSESLPGANSFGIVVPEAVPHLYSTPGDEHLLAYGGTSAERTKTIWEYLIRNPEKVVYAADDSGKHRVPWHLVEGKAVAGPPMRTSGFMSLFSPWMKPPSPNDFERIIK